MTPGWRARAIGRSILLTPVLQRVARLSSRDWADLSEVEDWIANGIPVGLSVVIINSVESPPLPAAICGLRRVTSDGEVILNDPGTMENVQKNIPTRRRQLPPGPTHEIRCISSTPKMRAFPKIASALGHQATQRMVIWAKADGNSNSTVKFPIHARSFTWATDHQHQKKTPGRIRQGVRVGNPAEEIVCSPTNVYDSQNTPFPGAENRSGTSWLEFGAKLTSSDCESGCRSVLQTNRPRALVISRSVPLNHSRRSP